MPKKDNYRNKEIQHLLCIKGDISNKCQKMKYLIKLCLNKRL